MIQDTTPGAPRNPSAETVFLDPHASLPVWLLPAFLRRQPDCLGPLRRVLSVADASAAALRLFPRLNRGEGVPTVPVHQALMQDVLVALERLGANLIELFNDKRWNSVISTAPLTVWLHIIDGQQY